MHTCRLAPTTSCCLVHTYRLAPTGSNADSKFESAEQRRLAPTVGSPFGTHLPTNADSQSAVGDSANCRLPVGRCALSIILFSFLFLVKRAGRHFGFFKRAGRHEKGAGRRALQKKPRQNIRFFEIKAGKITIMYDITLAKGQIRLDDRKCSFFQRTINIWSKLSTDWVHATIVLIMSMNRIDEHFVMAGYPDRLKRHC